MMMRSKAAGIALAVMGVVVASANANLPLDLTTAGSSGYINGAYFTEAGARSTGTGVIHSFVRLSSNDSVIEGLNTDGRPLKYDENSSPSFTRSLLLSLVPIVNIGGINYREFLLDINQNNSNSLLSLNSIKIYQESTGNITLLGNLTTKVFDLDTDTVDETIELDADLNSGSGSGDMFAYIPNSVFKTEDSFKYVYLYSMFGNPNPNNGGFEEWAVVKGGTVPIPAPAAAGLVMVGLGLVGFMKRRLA